MPKLVSPLFSDNRPIITWDEITTLTSKLVQNLSVNDSLDDKMTVKLPKKDEQSLFHFAFLTGASAAEIQGIGWPDIIEHRKTLEFHVGLGGRILFLPLVGEEMIMMRDMLETNRFFRETPFKSLDNQHNPGEKFGIIAKQNQVGRIIDGKLWPFTTDIFRSNLQLQLRLLGTPEIALDYMLGHKKATIPYNERNAKHICTLLREMMEQSD